MAQGFVKQGSKGSSSVPIATRPLLCVLLGIGLAAACPGSPASAECRSPGDRTPQATLVERNQVTIGRFENLGSSPEYGWLVRALPFLARAGLEGSDRLEIMVDERPSKVEAAHADGTPHLAASGEGQDGRGGWSIAGSFVEYGSRIKLDLHIKGGAPPQSKSFSRVAETGKLLPEFGKVLAEARAWLVAASPTTGPRQVAILCFSADGRQAKKISEDLALSLTVNFVGKARWIAVPWEKMERLCHRDLEQVWKELPEVDAVLGGQLALDGENLVVRPSVWLRTHAAKLEMVTLTAEHAAMQGALLASTAEFMNALSGAGETWNGDLLAQKATDAAGYLELARQAATRSNPDLVAVFLQRSLASEPQNSAALVQLGKTKLSQRRYADSERYLREAQKLTPDDAGVLEAFGDLYFARDSFQRAAASYERSVKTVQNTAAQSTAVLYEKLGEAYYLAQDYGHAREALEKSRDEQKKEEAALAQAGNVESGMDSRLCDRARTLTSLGNLYRAQDAPDLAMTAYSQALQAVPDYGEAKVGLRSLYLELAIEALDLPDLGGGTNKWEEASTKLAKALQYRPTAEVYELAAYVQDKLGRYEQVIELGRRAADEHVLSAQLDNAVTYALMERGRFDDALKHTDDALARQPDTAFLYRDKAEILYHLHRANEGLAVLDAGIERFGPIPVLTLQKAITQAYTGHYDDSLRTIDGIDATKLRGVDLANLFWKKGLVVQRARGCDDAIGWFDKAIAVYQGEADYYVGKAFCLGQMGKYREALTIADLALTRRPGYAHAFNHKAYALYHLGRREEAKSLSARVVRAQPLYALGRFNRARILAAEGDTAEALTELAAAMKSDPDQIRPLAEAAPEFAALRNQEQFALALRPPAAPCPCP
jgi:tetratricopeptide (TPR) repeat protein